MRIHSGLTRDVTHAHARDRVARRDATMLGTAATVVRHWGAALADAARRLPGRIARSLRDLRDGLRDWRVLVGVAVRSVRYGLYDPMTPTDLTPGARDLPPAGPMELIDPLDPHAGHVLRLGRRANGEGARRAGAGRTAFPHRRPDDLGDEPRDGAAERREHGRGRAGPLL